MAPQVGLAGMVTTVLGPATPADVEPLTGVASKLAECKTANQLAQYGVAPASARAYADIIADPDSWVEITANERHPGGTYTQADVAAGVLDARQGRIVSIPRRVNGELYGSFLPGSQENLQRALDGLVEFLPSGPGSTRTPTRTSTWTEEGTPWWGQPARSGRIRARRPGRVRLLRRGRRTSERIRPRCAERRAGRTRRPKPRTTKFRCRCSR